MFFILDFGAPKVFELVCVFNNPMLCWRTNSMLTYHHNDTKKRSSRKNVFEIGASIITPVSATHGQEGTRPTCCRESVLPKIALSTLEVSLQYSQELFDATLALPCTAVACCSVHRVMS